MLQGITPRDPGGRDAKMMLEFHEKYADHEAWRI